MTKILLIWKKSSQYLLRKPRREEKVSVAFTFKYVLGRVKGFLSSFVQHAGIPCYFSITLAIWKLHNGSPEVFFWTMDVAMFAFPCGTTLCSCPRLKELLKSLMLLASWCSQEMLEILAIFSGLAFSQVQNFWENSFRRLLHTYIVVLFCKWYLAVPLDFGFGN